MCGVGVFIAFFAVVMYAVLLFASSAVNWVTGWSWPHEILAAPLRWFSATNNMFGRIMIWDEDIMVTALYLSPLVLWGVGWWLTSRRIVTADRGAENWSRIAYLLLDRGHHWSLARFIGLN